MKIAYLSTFYPFRGGIAQFNAALYRILQKKHDIRAFTFTRQYPDFLFPGDTQMVGKSDNADKIDSLRILDTVNPLSYLKAARKINAFSPDILITKFWMPFFAPSLGYCAKFLKKNGCINISILDNVIPHEKRPGDIALTKFFLRNNHGFIVMSNSVKQDLYSLKHDAQSKFVPHPLYDHFKPKTNKSEARKALNIPMNKKVLLFFGFIRSYKGLDLLLESLSKLPDDYMLIIAGEVYGSFDKYQNIINSLELKDKVSLHIKYISDDEVPHFFSAADACVLPYKSATQSGIVGISYHYDLPVLAVNVGGLHEMIEPYQTGAMIDKATPEAITKTITESFSNDNLEKYASNISNYKSNYNWQYLADNITELYNQLTQ